MNEIQRHAKEIGIDLPSWGNKPKHHSSKKRAPGAIERRKKTKAQRKARKIQRGRA